jgi:hypothetical protein
VGAVVGPFGTTEEAAQFCGNLKLPGDSASSKKELKNVSLVGEVRPVIEKRPSCERK